MKKALKQGGANALNFYSTTAGVYLGWAYFPNIVRNATPYLDGIVVDWESMPGTSTRYAGQYDLGKTGTHEAGHWINLHHTFNGGCNRWGDYVDDTPAQTHRHLRLPRSVRTAARSRGSTRSTTTWTTRSTPVTTSSPRARPHGCRTPGCIWRA